MRSVGAVIRSRPWIGPVASAILLALAFAGLWPLVFVALVPLLISLRSATPREAWNRGYVFGLLFSLTQLWWLGKLAYVWVDSVVLGVVPWLLASFMSAVYYGLLGRLIRSCHVLNVLWVVPLTWAGMEVFRSYIPVLAFPWALLGEPLVVTPFRGLAWFGTIYLASAFVVAINLIVVTPEKRLARIGGAAAATTLALAYWLGPLPRRSGESDTVAAGQPGVDNAFDPHARDKEPSAIDALTSRVGGVDLLVFPEGVTDAGPSIPPHTEFRVPEGLPIVFGGQRGGGRGPVYQSAFAHDAAGWTSADKTRLVIFGEFVPGRDYFPFVQDAFHLPGGDLSAGDKLQTVRAGRLTVGPLICFEGLFPDLAYRQAQAGASVLAVMSIDDWFAPTAQTWLARAARWRATETGLPLVRAASLGQSMIVSDRGEVVADAPYGERRLVMARIGRGRGPFLLVWLFPAVAFGTLFAVPFFGRRRRKRGGAPPR